MKLFLILAISIFSHIGYGQFYFSLSEKIAHSNFSAFKPMEDRGYPAMDNSFLKLRFGGKYYWGDWAVHSNLGYSFGEDQNTSGKKRGAATGYGLNIGGQYSFYQVSDFQLFVATEIGLHQYHLNYFYKETTSKNLGFVEAFHFVGLGIHEDISIGLEKKFFFDRSEFRFGLSFGYRLDQREWNLLNNKKIRNTRTYHNGFIGAIEVTYRPIRKNK